MTANELESAGQGGAGEEPTPQPSPTPGQPASGVDVEALAEALVPKLQPFIDQSVERQWQSGKDRRIGKLEGAVSDIKSVLDEFNSWKKQGVSDEEALWRMEVSRKLSTREEPSPQDQPPGTRPPAANAETQAILQELGLDANNPEVVKVMRDTTDPMKLVLNLAKLSVTRTPPPSPNPAQAQPAGGGGQSVGNDVETLTQELNAIHQRGRRTPADQKRADEISAQLAQLLKR